MVDGWDLSWVTESRDALRVGRVVRVLASLGFLGALTIVIATLATRRSTHWAHWLLIPGVPVLIVGQLWAVAIQTARLQALRPPERRWWRSRVSNRDVLRALFEGLSAWQAALFLALFLLGWVTAFASGPDFHGFHASPQRFAAAIFMSFYGAHTAVSTAELARRHASQFARDRGF